MLMIWAISYRAVAHEVTPPRLLQGPAIELAESLPTPSIATATVTISPRGEVVTADLERSISAAADPKIIDAIRTWKFAPAVRDGKPIAAKIRVQAQLTRKRTSPPAEVEITGHRKLSSASGRTIARDVLDAAPQRSGSDLLRTVPGVFLSQHSGEGKAHQIFMRGFDAVHGQDVELWVGGAPANDVSNIHGQGYADLHFVIPEVVRKIVAQPGSFDVTQGDFAVAGTIRYELGYDKPGVTASAGYGSFGTRRLFLAYRPEGATPATFAAFESYGSEGFGPSRAASRHSAMGQFVHPFAGGTSLRVLTSVYTTRYDSAGVVLRSAVERGTIDRFATYDPSQNGQSSRAQFVVDLSRQEGESTWSVAPFFVLRGLRLRANYTGYLQEVTRGDGTEQLNDAFTFGATSRFERRVKLLTPNDAIEAGLYMRHDRIEQGQNRVSPIDDVPFATLVDADVRATDVAAFAAYRTSLFSRVTIEVGLRADGLAYTSRDVQAKDGIQGSWRTSQGLCIGKKATVTVPIAKALIAVASYGDGFRSPQARSLSDGQSTPFTTASTQELGLRYERGKRVEASVALFHASLSDDLLFDERTYRNERVPATRRLGVAWSLVARPHPTFLASLSGTYARATFIEGGPGADEGSLLPYVPQLVMRGDVAYKPELSRTHHLAGHFGAAFTGLHSRPLPYGEFGKDVFLVDASAAVTWRNAVTVKLDATNLLGGDWYDGEFVFASRWNAQATPSLVPERHVTVGPPRSIFATLSITY